MSCARVCGVLRALCVVFVVCLRLLFVVSCLLDVVCGLWFVRCCLLCLARCLMLFVR